MLADPALRRHYDRKLDCKIISGEYQEVPRERVPRAYPGQRLKVRSLRHTRLVVEPVPVCAQVMRTIRSRPFSALLQGLPTEVDVDLTFEEMFSGCVSHSHKARSVDSSSVE
jgi:hypothetical protein